MTENPEHETPTQPARPPFHDGWWDTIIGALLEEIDGEREERDRGPGR